jgi:hypothetical protein
MNTGSHGTYVQPGHRWTRVLNQSWPPAEVARRLTDVPIEQQIPVRVRVVFETGEEQLDGIATRWVKNLPHVRVAINDVRIVSGGVWVAPSDIERVSSPTAPSASARSIRP